MPQHSGLRFALCCIVLYCVVDSNPTSGVALVAQLVERSPILQSVVGLNPT